jgi:hypothetical protein
MSCARLVGKLEDGSNLIRRTRFQDQPRVADELSSRFGQVGRNVRLIGERVVRADNGSEAGDEIRVEHGVDDSWVRLTRLPRCSGALQPVIDGSAQSFIGDWRNSNGAGIGSVQRVQH